MRRFLNVLLAAALAFGWQLIPPAAQTAEAACGGAYCARLSISLSPGAGGGYAYSIPFGLDCTDYGGGVDGTCTYEFTLPGSGGMDVTIYLAPSTGAYACFGNDCGFLEQEIQLTVHLNPGANVSVGGAFNAAPNHMHLVVNFDGNGTARVTAPPLGIDCSLTAGTKSGTCAKDVYWINDTPVYSLVLNPADSSYVCTSTICRDPGETHTISGLNGVDGDKTWNIDAWVAKPVKVTLSGSGTVVSAEPGISCPSACSKWFSPDILPGMETSLTATPATGWTFKSWGGKCSGTSGRTCTFTLGFSGASVSATFARLATPQPTAKPTVKPTARPTAAPTSAPAATPAPASAAPAEATPAPSDSLPTDVAPTLEAPTTADPVESPAPAASPAPTPAAGPAGTPNPGTMDPIVLALLAVIGVLVLVVGFLLGARGRGRSAERATPPRA